MKTALRQIQGLFQKTLITVGLVAVLGAHFTAQAQEPCPDDALQIVYDVNRTLDQRNNQSLQRGWQVANAAIERCSDQFYTLVTSAGILTRLSSSVSSRDEAYVAASKAWDALKIANALSIPQENPQVKRPDGVMVAGGVPGSLDLQIELAAKRLAFLAGGQNPFSAQQKTSHDIFNPIAHPVTECPYTLDDQSGAAAEAKGLMRGAVEAGTDNGEFMLAGFRKANTRMDVLQKACPLRARFIAETRAEMYLKFGDNYNARGDKYGGNAFEQYNFARKLLDDSFEMTSEGRPYSTVEKLSKEADEKLAAARAMIAASRE